MAARSGGLAGWPGMAQAFVLSFTFFCLFICRCDAAHTWGLPPAEKGGRESGGRRPGSLCNRHAETWCWLFGLPVSLRRALTVRSIAGRTGRPATAHAVSAAARPTGGTGTCDGHFSELTILDQTYGAAARWYFYNIFWEPAGWWVWNGRSPTVLAPGRGVAGAL